MALRNRGVSNDRSHECENGSDSILLNRDFDVNDITESYLEAETHDDTRLSTLSGIPID
jgi:hypothetical protein